MRSPEQLQELMALMTKGDARALKAALLDYGDQSAISLLALRAYNHLTREQPAQAVAARTLVKVVGELAHLPYVARFQAVEPENWAFLQDAAARDDA